MIGLPTVAERYLTLDHEATHAQWSAVVDQRPRRLART